MCLISYYNEPCHETWGLSSSRTAKSDTIYRSGKRRKGRAFFFERGTTGFSSFPGFLGIWLWKAVEAADGREIKRYFFVYPVPYAAKPQHRVSLRAYTLSSTMKAKTYIGNSQYFIQRWCRFLYLLSAGHYQRFSTNRILLSSKQREVVWFHILFCYF